MALKILTVMSGDEADFCIFGIYHVSIEKRVVIRHDFANYITVTRFVWLDEM